MNLPFTYDQFIDVFRRYNDGVWPAQGLLVGLAVAAVLLGLRRSPSCARWASGILAALWIWAGIAYHLAYFARINPAAVLFGVAFAAQSALFAWLAWRPGGLEFRPLDAVTGVVGGVLITYALVAYPLLATALGHRYPATPTFGVPCPTTIFTLGMLVWAGDRAPRRLLVVPVAWSVVGLAAATLLRMREDLVLAPAALLALALSYRRRVPARLPLAA